MDFSGLLGYAAGFLTTVAFIPQAIKIWRTRSAQDVSLPTFIAFTIGVGLWLTYGIILHQAPMILWNAVTLVFAAAILVMKVKFR